MKRVEESVLVLVRGGNEKRREEEDASLAQREEHLGWLE